MIKQYPKPYDSTPPVYIEGDAPVSNPLLCLPEPVSIIGHGPVANFTSVQPALKTKPYGEIKCYAEDDMMMYAEQRIDALKTTIKTFLHDLDNHDNTDGPIVMNAGMWMQVDAIRRLVA